MAPPETAEYRRRASSFVGSFPDGPDQALIVLRGDLDGPTLERLALHLEAIHSDRTRFLTIHASGVTRADPALLDLMGCTQRRLTRRHGLLTVRGLHPLVLAAIGTVDDLMATR